jgi:hypothetical protein
MGDPLPDPEIWMSGAADGQSLPDPFGGIAGGIGDVAGGIGDFFGHF